MTAKTKEELGKRAVACKAWRWMPGMLVITGPARLKVRLTGSNVSQMPFGLTGDAYPDITDPATRGCIDALVEEASGMKPMSPTVYIEALEGLS